MSGKLKILLVALVLAVVGVGGYFLVNFLVGQKGVLLGKGGPDPNISATFRFGWEGHYRPERWTPVDVTIPATKLKEYMDAKVTFRAQQDKLTNLVVDRGVTLSPRTPVNTQLITKIRYGSENCELSIADKDGRRLWSTGDYGLYSPGSQNAELTAVPREHVLIGLCKGKETTLRAMNKFARVRNSSTSGQQVYVCEKRPEALPEDWLGFDSLDLLVLYDLDLNALKPLQAQAICRYVSSGGKLLIVMGAKALPADSPIAKMLPLKVTSPHGAKLYDFSRPAEGSSPAASTALPATMVGQPVVLWTLQTPAKTWALYSSRIKSAQDPDAEPLLAAGPVGFGSVAVLACDPTDLLSKEPVAAAQFWAGAVNCMDDRLTAVDTEPDESDSYYGYGYGSSYDVGPARPHSDRVLAYLLAIPELRPLSIWWVIGLLGALALLLGPVDYFVLKKLDRLPLTWVTSTVIIVLFSVGAYYGVEKIRGGSLQMRMVSVVDAVQDGPDAWSTSYGGIFAPESDSYSLSGLGQGQWWSAASPSQSGDSMEHGYSDGGTAERTLYCTQFDGASHPTDIPINIWSMQCLMCQQHVDLAKDSRKTPLFPFAVSISPPMKPDGQPIMTVTNRSQATITGGSVRVLDGQTQSGRMVIFGRIESGQSAIVELVYDRPWDAGDEAWRDDVSPPDERHILGAVGVEDRTAAMVRYMKAGAQVVTVRMDDAPSTIAVRDRSSQLTHVQYARLVLPPK